MSLHAHGIPPEEKYIEAWSLQLEGQSRVHLTVEKSPDNHNFVCSQRPNLLRYINAVVPVRWRKSRNSMGLKPKREDTLGKTPELYIVNKTVLKSRDRIIDLPWKMEENSTDVDRNVTNILDNTGPRQSPLSTEWLVSQIAKINQQIYEVDTVRNALIQARDHFMLLLSSQKGGENDDAEAEGSRGNADVEGAEEED
ncbi:hypothetical protein RND71_018169 [Anisodus tanguticus]|uniref:Uncharacterized protein n=1 Tax=Anisodus tanguticus TaxID=243964 RepID=A0AAE1S557_9SOLA|nr:hypothetical protein RND71_018169 [Anisodus tanguticus]